MPPTRWIRTETPDSELWRQLGQYRYGDNIRRYHVRWNVNAAEGIEDYVAGSIGQAEAYFAAAKAAPIDISPLLLYYGATALLTASAALIRGNPLPIDQHGMAMGDTPSSPRISDLEIVVRNTPGAGLQELARVFGASSALPGQSKWTVGELLTSLPDMKDDVRLMMPTAPTHCLRLERMKASGVSFERICQDEFGDEDAHATVERIERYRSAYLPYQLAGDGLVLYRKLGGESISTESLSGQPVLLVGHQKGKALVTPGQILAQLMILFALGSVSRYRPTFWHPFVRADATGERLLTERFLALAGRWLPNLALSAISRDWIRLTSEAIREPSELEGMSESDLKKMVLQIVQGQSAS